MPLSSLIASTSLIAFQGSCITLHAMPETSVGITNQVEAVMGKEPTEARISEAKVVNTDIDASNGVVHVIESLILSE
tara:strand:+ start:85 stop:315 length:231 start_codon:yes stop_codon:yes gene_type:complete